MERDEAKIILELCRPGDSEDTKDPVIAEALARLETDRELKAWFTEQQSVDARIFDCCGAIQPPAELKANILVGMRLHALNRKDAEASREAAIVSDPAPFNRNSQSWWRNPWVGIAAVFALLFAMVSIPRETAPVELASSARPTLQAGIPPMIEFLAAEIDSIKTQKRSFAKQCDQPKNLQTYLASVGAPSPHRIPAPIEGTPSIGCFTLDYNGIKMGMICFKNEEVIHLITARKTDCARFVSDQPAVYEIGEQAFKVWVEADQVFILSIKGSKEKLPKFI